MTREDERTAVGISVTLSGQLITSALAMLTLEGGYVAYVLGNRNPNNAFSIFAVAAGLGFIFSIFVAGKGITQSRNSGHIGHWSLSKGKDFFNYQAIFCLVGIFFFGLMLFNSGPRTTDNSTTEMNELKRIQSEQEVVIRNLTNQLTVIDNRLHLLENDHQNVKKRFDDIAKSPEPIIKEKKDIHSQNNLKRNSLRVPVSPAQPTVRTR